MRQTIVFVAAVLLFGVEVAQAAVDPAKLLDTASSNSATVPENSNDAVLPASDVADAGPRVASPFVLTAPLASPRPAGLVPLYISFAILQALDLDSTIRAIRNGAGREANPMLQESIDGNLIRGVQDGRIGAALSRRRPC